MSADPPPSQSHVVIIPSYNTGPKILETVTAVLRYWRPILIVIDGSTDDSPRRLEELCRGTSGVQLLKLPKNRGKGAAVMFGLTVAKQQGLKFALVMDADGQHPADRIREFMAASERNPDAMILGKPEFGEEAPASRRQGRRVGNWWANLETLWGGIHDSLFGFRVYPVDEALEVLRGISGGRRYDFDTQLAVRLFWRGVRPINIATPVRYFTRAEGGVSHFHYIRDNLLLIWTHIQLVLQAPLRMFLRPRRRAPYTVSPGGP